MGPNDSLKGNKTITHKEIAGKLKYKTLFHIFLSTMTGQPRVQRRLETGYFLLYIMKLGTANTC